MRGVKGERVPLVNGAGIFLDLDNFKEVMRKMGWSEFRPNPITGTLTQLVQRLAAKYNATVLWGLDPERGTEEAYMEVVEPDTEELISDLEEVRKEIEKLGKETKSNAHLSIGVAYGKIGSAKPRSRREITRTPLGYRAWRALKKAKKTGGNKIVQI